MTLAIFVGNHDKFNHVFDCQGPVWEYHLTPFWFQNLTFPSPIAVAAKPMDPPFLAFGWFDNAKSSPRIFRILLILTESFEITNSLTNLKWENQFQLNWIELELESYFHITCKIQCKYNSLFAEGITYIHAQ